MKAKNNNDINRGYLRFSCFLVACIFIGISGYSLYMKTVEIELNRIVEKTSEYDKIYVRQNDLVNRIDSLYQYINLFNTNLNDALLLNLVSERKQEILASMEDMNSRDIRLYQKLTSEMNTFFDMKDSIRLLTSEEILVKRELKKCIENNKQAVRKLTLGGITIEK
jgi:hypothetical protein